MDFSSLIKKNIKHNIRNYTAFLFGNIIIQCILLMFFTLAFSSEFEKIPSSSAIKSDFNLILTGMILFSIFFVLYTAVTFTKYRGREFGVYYTMGLTSKQIIKILSYENIIISFASFIIGTITGVLFSKLFFMIISSILKTSEYTDFFNIKAVVIVFLISIAIFLISTLYQLYYIRKTPIVEILKSKAKKDIGKTSFITGIISLVAFIASLILYKKSFSDTEYSSTMLKIGIGGTFISLYFVIGFAMTFIVKTLKYFKRFYNNNILFINSLSHRFYSLRNVLYIVSIMASGAIIFTSLSYSTYKSVKITTDTKYKYDLSFVVPLNTSESRIKEILKDNDIRVKQYNELEGLNVFDLRVTGEDLIPHGISLVISEDSYRKFTGESLNLRDNELLYGKLSDSGLFKNSNILFDCSNVKKTSTFSEYKKKIPENKYMFFEQQNKKYNKTLVTNSSASKYFIRGINITVNNENYKKLSNMCNEESKTKDILLNIDPYDYNYYKKNLQQDLKKEFGDKFADTLCIKQEEFDEFLKSSQFNLFTYSFLGFMFLIGSSAILYFKTIVTSREDVERALKLSRLGLTTGEILKISYKELAATFLLPPLLAILIIGYFLKNMLNLIPNGEVLFYNCFHIFALYIAIQIIFYVVTAYKYKIIIKDI